MRSVHSETKTSRKIRGREHSMGDLMGRPLGRAANAGVVEQAHSARGTSRSDTGGSTTGRRDTERSKTGLLERGWIGAVVGYSILRFVAAWGALGRHGVNPWIFGFIDIATAYPYARAVAEVAKRSARRAWSTLLGPVVVAAISFVAPYIYLWIAGREAPVEMRIGLVVLVLVLATAAVLGVVSQARKLRVAT